MAGDLHPGAWVEIAIRREQGAHTWQSGFMLDHRAAACATCAARTIRKRQRFTRCERLRLLPVLALEHRKAFGDLDVALGPTRSRLWNASASGSFTGSASGPPDAGFRATVARNSLLFDRRELGLDLPHPFLRRLEIGEILAAGVLVSLQLDRFLSGGADDARGSRWNTLTARSSPREDEGLRGARGPRGLPFCR